MTLAVLPEGGQQPSASGHQFRSGGNMVANSRGPARPETYSRGVQTGYPDSSGNAGHQQMEPAPGCLCGHRGEGSCWCESIGLLKDLKVYKKRWESRVAFLKDIHEEACRLARGDPVIVARRRGSAHADPRIRHPKAPPPTLPRPRAQSFSVRNSKAASKKSEASQPHVQKQPQGQEKHIGNTSPSSQGTVGRACDSVAKCWNGQQKAGNNVCTDTKGTAENMENRSEEQSCTDQNSYVSQAWLLFKGWERGKRVAETAERNDEANEDQACAKDANSADPSQRLNQQAARGVAMESSVQDSSSKDQLSRIKGLKCSSLVKGENAKSKSDQVSSGNKRKVSHLSGGEGSNGLSTRSEKDTGSARPSKMGKKDVEPEGGAATSVVISCSSDRLGLEDNSTEPMERSDHANNLPLASSSKCNMEDSTIAKDWSQCLDDISIDPLELCSDCEVQQECVPISEERTASRESLGVMGEIVGHLESSGSLCTVGGSSELPLSDSESKVNTESTNHVHFDTYDSAHTLLTSCNISTTNSESENHLPEPCSPDSSDKSSDKSELGACAMFESDADCLVPKHEDFGVLNAEITVSATIFHGPPTDHDHRVTLIGADSDTDTSDATSDSVLPHSPSLSQETNSCFESKQQLKDKKIGHEVDIDPSEPSDEEDGDVLMQEVVLRNGREKKSNKKSEKVAPRRILNPAKHGFLKCLISQSPLVQCEPSDSDEDDSDSECDEPIDIFSRMPYHIVANIFKYLNTHDLANLKCVCKNFKWLIVFCNIQGVDSDWAEMEQYRDDPCMQCGKIRDPRGDVSLCRWHPKNYYPIGGSDRWACCLRVDRATPGCQVGLHNNNWTKSKAISKSIPKPWRNHTHFVQEWMLA